MSSKVTYRKQYTRCGKERCRKCKEGDGHGPYWYAYWSEKGRTISKYIGIHLPPDIDIERQTVGEIEAGKGVPPLTANQSPHSNKAVTSNTTIGSAYVERLPLQLNTQVLRIFALGQFRVERLQGNEWCAVINRTWYRRRARALLGCLLSSPGRRLGREQVMEALWPDLDMETAANRLNGAVHELRQILEPEIARPAASRMLRLERDVLELADRTQIWVDAEAFESVLKEANSLLGIHGSNQTSTYQSLDIAKANHLEQLIEVAAVLYTGDYLLEELYSEWAAPRREALKRGWTGLLLKLAELREARMAYASAMEPLNRLLATDPTDETAVQRLMILLIQLDRRGEALNTYRRLASRLERNYDSEPLLETRELYEKLLMGQISEIAQPKFLISHPANIQQNLETQDEKQVKQSQNALNQYGAQDKEAPAKVRIPHQSQDAEKTIAHVVAPFVGTSQLGRYNQSPLIGREHELEMMRHVMFSLEGEEITPGNTPSMPGAVRNRHVLLLMGEAGIGKTRLAEELSHEANTRSWAVAWTRAYEQESAVPYRPWIELLRTLLQHVPTELLISSVSSRTNAEAASTEYYAPTSLERLSTLLPELRGILPQNDRTYPHLPPEQERLHLWEATAWLLSTLSKTTPLLLVLDDLHWTDGSSRELLAYITRHIQDERILLLGTCRDVELSPGHGLRTLIADLRREQTIVTVAVQPLTQSQIGTLVAHLPQNIVHSIQTQAAGNPFFAEELARMSEAAQAASAQPEVHRQETSSHKMGHTVEGEHLRVSPGSTLPEGITAVLERRLGRLSSECQALLGKAAVLGGSFEFGHLLFMANEHPEDMILDLLEEALRAGLLTEEGTGSRIIYHFWHPLIVSHLYEHLSAARCAQLHRRAASALLRAHQGHEGEIAAAITYHLNKGGADPTKVAHYAELAGNQAYSLSAFAEAEQYYIQAVQTITHGKLTLKEVEYEAGLHKADIAEPLHVARLLERVCECTEVQGKYEEARRYYDCILVLRNQRRTFASEDEWKQEAQIQALIWREIVRTWTANGFFDQAYECYQRGKQAMLEAGVTSGAAWACVHLELGSIRSLQGNYDESTRIALEALEMLEQAMQEQKEESEYPSVSYKREEEPGALNERNAHNINNYSSFQTRTERAILGAPLEVGRAHELLGVIAANVGQFAEALQQLHKALAIFEQHDLATALAQVYSNLGAVHAVKSENSMALTYMQRSLELAERLGNQPNIAIVTGNLGEMATRSGKLRQAEEWFRRSLAMAERINEADQISWCNTALAVSLQDQGNLADAAVCIRRSLSIARSMKSTRNIGGALLALANLRVMQAIIVGKLQHKDKNTENVSCPTALCTQLLMRAKSTIQRALVVEGLETELVVEGQLILASIYFLLGDIEKAKQETVRTIEEAEQYELTRLLARSSRLLGRILAVRGEYTQANVYFDRALQIFRECEFRLDYARALHGYGVTLIERRIPGDVQFDKGLAYLQEARDIFADCHAGIDLEWVEHILANYRSETVRA
ncbi:MAG: tetratricopeptide repeat protein [Chloroflexi bacterium]|nr:MAG: tetratricopeptide repeat protein [Chloroflexota bacterium]